MSWRTGLLLPFLTGFLLTLMGDRPALGQPDKQPMKLDSAGVDKIVDATLREVLLRGVPLYNNGDFDGSYRLYEGSLMAVKPLLTHRPNLQKEIEGALIIADRTTEVPKRAWVLRETMDKIRTEVKGGKSAVEPAPIVGSVNGLVSIEREVVPAGTITLIGADNKRHSGAITKGKYDIQNLPAGEYRVIVGDEIKDKIEAKYLDVRTTPLLVKVVDRSPVTFNIGLKGAEPKVSLGAITGKLTLDGKPFEGAKVIAASPGVAAKIAVVGKDGTFNFDKLKFATYKLYVPADQGGPKYDPKVQDVESTPFRVEVKEEKPVRFDISLKSEKKVEAIKPERLNIAPAEVVKPQERRVEALKVAPSEVKPEVKPEPRPEPKERRAESLKVAPNEVKVAVKSEVPENRERRPESLRVEPVEFRKPGGVVPEVIKEAPLEKKGAGLLERETGRA